MIQPIEENKIEETFEKQKEENVHRLSLGDLEITQEHVKKEEFTLESTISK